MIIYFDIEKCSECIRCDITDGKRGHCSPDTWTCKDNDKVIAYVYYPDGPWHMQMMDLNTEGFPPIPDWCERQAANNIIHPNGAKEDKEDGSI